MPENEGAKLSEKAEVPSQSNYPELYLNFSEVTDQPLPSIEIQIFSEPEEELSFIP